MAGSPTSSAGRPHPADERMREAIEAAGLRATFSGRTWHVYGLGVDIVVDRLGSLSSADLVPVLDAHRYG